MPVSDSLFLVLAMICSASMAVGLRFFRLAKNRYGMILGNYLTCMVIGFLMIGNRSMLLQCHVSTWILGMSGGVLFVLSLVCMQSSIASSGAIMTSAFSKLGLLVPLLLSTAVFHERPDLMQYLGLAAVIGSILIMNGTDDKERNINLPFLIIVLITNGMSDAMAKIYSTIGIPSEETVYMFLLFLCAAVLTAVLMIIETKRTGRKPELKDLAAGICIGIPNYFSSIFLLRSLRTIPAVIAYPVFSSGTIMIVTAAGCYLFHEHLSQRQIIGLGLILVSLVLLNL